MATTYHCFRIDYNNVVLPDPGAVRWWKLVVDLGSLEDFKTFGNGLAAAQVLDVKGKVLR